MSTLTLVGNVKQTQTDGKPYLLVSATCPQRPDLSLRYGIGLKITHRALADRLVRAINAGVVFTDVRVAKDVHDDEYITSTCHTIGRRLNADLQRLGF